MKENNSRRRFLKYGAGVATAAVASKALSSTCNIKTGEQPLGPFFPKPGTPKKVIRENSDPNTPIYLANDNDLTYINGQFEKADGQQVLITGVVIDKKCKPIPDANIIIWQASHSGMYNHQGDQDNLDFKHPETGKLIKRKMDHNFQFWGKTTTDKHGNYSFKTVVPGFYPADIDSGWYRPPHIHFMVSAMGHQQLVTQMYFKGDTIRNNKFIQKLNQKDPLLQSSGLSKTEREALVVEFKRVFTEKSYLQGRFDIKLKS